MKLTATVVDAADQPQPEPEYPCLMRIKDTPCVVYFSGQREGIVVNPSDVYSLGHSSTYWTMSGFEPFYGTVTLESKP